jgi:adenylate kinase
MPMMEPLRATEHRARAGISSRSLAPRILITGRPGAGKGTQGPRLARRLGVQYLSTGDLLRREIAMETALGIAVERLVGSGRLVPTGLILSMVSGNLHSDGYVLDGYPRTIAQADALFKEEGLVPDLAINLVVPNDIVRDRLAERGRGDDTGDAIRRRLAAYDAETLPMLARLGSRGLLRTVNGNDSAGAIEINIRRTVLESLRWRRSFHRM